MLFEKRSFPLFQSLFLKQKSVRMRKLFAMDLRTSSRPDMVSFFISQSTTQGSLTKKEKPCSSEMAETRGDTMFPHIFLARTVPTYNSVSAKPWEGGIARHFKNLFPFFCIFSFRFFYSRQPSVSSAPEVRKNQAIPKLWSPSNRFTF